MGNKLERLKRQLNQLDGFLVEWDTDNTPTEICGLIGLLDEEVETFYDGHRNEHRHHINLQMLDPTGRVKKLRIYEDDLNRFLTTGILGINLNRGRAYETITVRALSPLPVFEDVTLLGPDRSANP